MKETEKDKKDAMTFSYDRKGTTKNDLVKDMENPWLSAQDAAGLPDMPTTARRARDYLERVTADQPLLKRKKKGSKATEYHMSALPLQTILYLLDRQETSEPNELKENSAEYTITNKDKSEDYTFSDFLEEFALIPGYRVQVSAGHGSVGDSGNAPCRHLAFRRKWLRYRGFKESDLVVVWARGDSMEPTISSNNTLLINTAKTKPTDGHIYVIRQEDMLWVKRIQVLMDGSWLLISDNSTYKPVEIKPDAMHNLQVIGQVVNIAKDVGD